MATYHLEVVSIDGLEYEGEVEKVLLRTIDGDVEILDVNIDIGCSLCGLTYKYPFRPGASFFRPEDDI